jgi:hypothetical protein
MSLRLTPSSSQRSYPRACDLDASPATTAHYRVKLPNVSDIGDSIFHKGQPIWVMEPDGSQRAAEYVGEGELSAWFGGTPTVFVVYADTREGAAVEVDRVIARDP